VHGDGVADPGHASCRQAQDLYPRPDAEQLKCTDVRSVRIEIISRRVADQDRDAADRGGRKPVRAAEPIAAPVGGERPRGRLERVPPRDLVQRRQEHLFDRALDRPQRERRLDRRVRALALERHQRADERVSVGRESLARAGNGRRNRQSLLKRIPQRGDLAMREKPVLTRRPLRLGKAKSALPRPQRIRANVEQRSCLAGLQIAHSLERSGQSLSIIGTGDKIAQALYLEAVQIAQQASFDDALLPGARARG